MRVFLKHIHWSGFVFEKEHILSNVGTKSFIHRMYTDEVQSSAVCVCVYVCMRLYIYIYIYIYIYTHTHTHTYIYIYIYIHTYTYTYIYIHTHTHTHTYICVYMRVCVKKFKVLIFREFQLGIFDEVFL